MKALKLTITAEIPLPDDAVELADAVKAIDEDARNLTDMLRANYEATAVVKLDLRDRRKPKTEPVPSPTTALEGAAPPEVAAVLALPPLGPGCPADPGPMPERMRRT